MWHDAARLGATGISAHLRNLEAASDSLLISVRALHVAALESGDPSALVEASKQLEGLGLDLAAAEAAGSAADAFRRGGDQRSGAREAAVPRQSRPDAQVRSPPGWPPSTPSFP